MKANFSFNRVFLIVRADIIERGKRWLYSCAALLAGWLFLRYLIFRHHVGSPGEMFGFFLLVFGFIALLVFCIHAGRKLHRTKGHFLILPASNGEKYASLLLEGLMFLVALSAVYFCGLYTICCTPDMNGIVFSNALPMISMAAFIFALVFLSYMSFPKLPFLIVSLGSMAFLIINLYIFYRIFKNDHVVYNLSFRSGERLTVSDLPPENLHLLDAISTLNQCTPYVILAAVPVLLYIAYLKLKEKEKR